MGSTHQALLEVGVVVSDDQIGTCLAYRPAWHAERLGYHNFQCNKDAKGKPQSFFRHAILIFMNAFWI